MSSKKGRNIVVWSGGADSTCLLHYYGSVSSKDHPVIAVSVVSHPYLAKPHMKRQVECQRRYLALAKKRGYHIKHWRFRIGGNFRHSEDGFNPQPVMWMSVLSQIVQANDRVTMGYIRKDDIWHYRSQLIAVFDALCALKCIEGATLEFPFEYERKSEILGRLERYKIPDNCWFSCEATTNGRPCGKCMKCLDIASARDELAH